VVPVTERHRPPADRTLPDLVRPPYAPPDVCDAPPVRPPRRDVPRLRAHDYVLSVVVYINLSPARSGAVRTSGDGPSNRRGVGPKGAAVSTTPDGAVAAGRSPGTAATPGDRDGGGVRGRLRGALSDRPVRTLPRVRRRGRGRDASANAGATRARTRTRRERDVDATWTRRGRDVDATWTR
jgi:hypothetical protein